MNGGTSRTRTDRLLLAKQALSQMSYGPKIFNALKPMRVFKDTMVSLALALVLESRRIMSLNTLPFYASRLSPETYHPVGRPHLQFITVFCRVAFPINTLSLEPFPPRTAMQCVTVDSGSIKLVLNTFAFLFLC